MTKYRINVWIPVEIEPTEEEHYDSYDEAYQDMAEMGMMHPENRLEIEEIEVCPLCEYETRIRMIDQDGTNLIEKEVCTNPDCPNFE